MAMKRWMMPMPPWLAIATAMAASVTVSMLALTMGMPRVMCRERRVAVDTCLREATSERLGTSSTSSYVSPWGRKSAIVILPDSVSGISQMAPPAVAPSSVTPCPAPPYIITRLVLAALQYLLVLVWRRFHCHSSLYVILQWRERMGQAHSSQVIGSMARTPRENENAAGEEDEWCSGHGVTTIQRG